MNEAWQAAELLEEIAKHAEPTSILRKCVGDIINKTRTAKVSLMLLTDPEEGTLTVSYLIPVAGVMATVEHGTPEEILEYLQTGLRPDLEATLTTGGHAPAFVLKQIHRDRYTLEDANELMEKLMTHAKQKRQPPPG